METNTKSYVKSMDHEFLDAVKPLMRRVKVARTKKQRLQSIRELQAYLNGWIQVLEYSSKKTSMWLSWLHPASAATVSAPPPGPRAIAFDLEETKKKSMGGINDVDDCSLIGSAVSVYSSRTTSEVDEEAPTKSMKSMEMDWVKLMSMIQGGMCEDCGNLGLTAQRLAYECDGLLEVPAAFVSTGSSLDEDTDDYGHRGDAASLRLMTCGSLDNADAQMSVAAISTAIIGYDSKKAYDSYGFQSFDAAKSFDGYAQLDPEIDTVHSTVAVSFDEASSNTNNNQDEDECSVPDESRVVPDFVDNRAAMMKAVMEQVAALFGGLGEDMGVEIMEVVPGGSGDIAATIDAPRSQSPATAVGANDRDEVESLRSARSGHVRKMVNTFDGRKP